MSQFYQKFYSVFDDQSSTMDALLNGKESFASQHIFPWTLEAFVLHALSPVGVEVLTRKFEQMDQMIGSDDRSQFYQKFYSVFDDQSSAMDALLNGKEPFASQIESALPTLARPIMALNANEDVVVGALKQSLVNLTLLKL